MAKKAASKAASNQLVVKLKQLTNGRLVVAEVITPDTQIPFAPFGVVVFTKDQGTAAKAAAISFDVNFLEVILVPAGSNAPPIAITSLNGCECVVEIAKDADIGLATSAVTILPEKAAEKKPEAAKTETKKPTAKKPTAKKDKSLTVEDDVEIEDEDLEELEEEELEDEDLEEEDLEEEDLEDEELEDEELEDEELEDEDLYEEELEEEELEDEDLEDEEFEEELEDEEIEMTPEDIAKLLKQVKNSTKESFIKNTAEEFGIEFTDKWSLAKIKKALISLLESDVEE